MTALATMICAAAFAAQPPQIRLETPDGKPFEASNVTFTVERSAGADGCTTAKCRLVAQEDGAPTLVRIIAAAAKEGTDLTLFDGRAPAPFEPGKTVRCPLMTKTSWGDGHFAFGALWDGAEGIALGVGADGEDSFVELTAQGKTGRATMAVAVNAALMRKGAAYACTFHTIPFRPKYGERDALARYYRLYPNRFRRNPAVNEAVFGICASYACWKEADPETCRFMHATWEWCHGSSRTWGDPLGTVTPTPPSGRDYTYVDRVYGRLRDGKDFDYDNVKLSADAFHDIQRKRRAEGYFCGVANGFYLMGMSNISNIFADRYPDSLAGPDSVYENPYPFSTYVYAFPQCSWGKELRRQLAELARNEDLGCFAFDVSAPGGIYRGVRLREMDNVGFDRHGPGIARGIANGRLCDFVAGLSCRSLPGMMGSAVNTCPGQLNDVLHADMTMIEQPPWASEPPFPRAFRYAAGEKGVTFWEGYTPRDFDPNFYKWPLPLRNKMLSDLARFAVHQQFAWGVSLPACFVSEYVSRVSAAFVACNDAGWKPVPGAMAEKPFTVARYGLGEETLLVANNLERRVVRCRLKVFPDELRSGRVGSGGNATPVVFVPFFGGEALNGIGGAEGHVEMEIGPQLVGVLEAVGAAEGKGTLAVSWQGGFGKACLYFRSEGFAGRVTPRRTFGTYAATDAAAFTLAAGETREVTYFESTVSGDVASVKLFPYKKGKDVAFRIERASGSDAVDIADRVAAFFKGACGIRPEIVENASLAEWTVVLVPDGAASSAGGMAPGIILDAARMSVRGKDRMDFSRLSRRFLDGLNQTAFPDYVGSGVRMLPTERQFFTFRRM